MVYPQPGEVAGKPGPHPGLLGFLPTRRHVARHGFGPRPDMHLLVDMFEMAAYRLDTEVQFVRDLLVE